MYCYWTDACYIPKKDIVYPSSQTLVINLHVLCYVHIVIYLHVVLCYVHIMINLLVLCYGEFFSSDYVYSNICPPG